MTTKDTGGPAFPRPASDAHTHGMHQHQTGMDLRDYFAAKAMHAVIVTPSGFTVEGALGVAKIAYEMADAMIAARTA